MTWYHIKLSRYDFEAGELEILKGAFREAYVACNGPRGMALLGRWDSERECYDAYVTPAAVRHVKPLLLAYSARPATPRSPLRLAWLSGDQDGLSVLVC